MVKRQKKKGKKKDAIPIVCIERESSDKLGVQVTKTRERVFSSVLLSARALSLLLSLSHSGDLRLHRISPDRNQRSKKKKEIKEEQKI
jgi:hypothetical protein